MIEVEKFELRERIEWIKIYSEPEDLERSLEGLEDLQNEFRKGKFSKCLITVELFGDPEPKKI